MITDLEKEAIAKGCGQKRTTVYLLTARVEVSEVEVYCVACSAGSQMSLRLRPQSRFIVGLS